MIPAAVAHPVLKRAVAAILRPLFRVLLRHAVSFVAFEELAKRVYVELALEEFAIPGRKPSVSRVSILSGLTRKDVQRVLAEPPEAAVDGSDRYNRAARVVTGWVRDADFTGPDGVPRPLDLDGAVGFSELVRRHSGDMPVRAVLNELVRTGAAAEREDGRIELVSRAYVPRSDEAEKLAILGTDVADLISTIDHNLRVGDTSPRFQRKVMYQSIPVEALGEFRRLSAAQSQRLLEQLDRWLAEHDTDIPDGSVEPRARVGLGIYYVEEPLARGS